MAFPITYEGRYNSKLVLLVVATEKDKYTKYFSDGNTKTQDDYGDEDKGIFNEPRSGIGYMGIATSQSRADIEQPITENASAELIDSLIKEIQKPSK
jgi:hypothetical protein